MRSQSKSITPFTDFSLALITNSLDPQLALLQKIYHQELVHDFPIKGELASWDEIKLYLGKNNTPLAYSNKKGKHLESWVLVLQNKEPIACCNYDLLHITKNIFTGAIIYIVVAKKYRHKGIASYILDALNTLAKKQMPQLLPKNITLQPQLFGWFIEINDPHKMSKTDILKDATIAKEDPYQRIQFWHHHGYKHIELNYLQPALKSSGVMVKAETLCVNTQHFSKSISSSLLKAHLQEYIGFTYMTKEQAKTDPALKQMLLDLSKKPTVPLHSLQKLV